jgi:hypothetical protein
MLPFLRRGFPFKVLISRHIDGEINAIAAEWLGVSTVRGSGDHGRRYQVKGSVGAFKSMMDALADGWNMALTPTLRKSRASPGSASSSSRAQRDDRSSQLRSPPAAGSGATTKLATSATIPRIRTTAVCTPDKIYRSPA